MSDLFIWYIHFLIDEEDVIERVVLSCLDFAFSVSLSQALSFSLSPLSQALLLIFFSSFVEWVFQYSFSRL